MTGSAREFVADGLQFIAQIRAPNVLLLIVGIGYLAVTSLGNIGAALDAVSAILQGLICLATPFALR